MKYKFVCVSKNDPNGDKGGLGFNSFGAAKEHMLLMNSVRHTYPTGWNTEFWKEQPEEWIIKEVK